MSAATIGEGDTRYALELVARICRQVGPGLPGSPQERGRAELLRRELAAQLGADRVVVEEFDVAPGAFTGSLPVAALLALVAAAMAAATGWVDGVSPWLTAVAGLACAGAAVAVVVLEFLLQREVLDRWFRWRRSVNVIGTLPRRAAGGAGRLLLISGHHDSAPVNTWFRLLGLGGLAVSSVMFVGLAVMLGVALVQVGSLVAAGAGAARLGTVGWILLAFPVAPAVVAAAFYTHGRRGGGRVPGAVDNLAACAIVAALARWLVRHPDSLPDDVEVRFVCFGSEEAGTRGSRRYVARHRDELTRRRARLLNVEMVAYPVITIFSSDLNGAVPHTRAMVRSAVAAARTAGVAHQVKPAGVGVATDAWPFSQVGLDATTLYPFSSPRQLAAFYHQPDDEPEALTPEPVAAVLALAAAWLGAGGEPAPA